MSEVAYTFIRLPDVLRRTGHSEATLYRLIEADQFPHPINISERAVGWREDLVNAWCHARVAASEAIAAKKRKAKSTPRARLAVGSNR